MITAPKATNKHTPIPTFASPPSHTPPTVGEGHVSQRMAQFKEAMRGFIKQSRRKSLPDHVSADGGLLLPGAGVWYLQGTDGDVYFVGIIDILQKFNLRKRGEASFKGLLADK